MRLVVGPVLVFRGVPQVWSDAPQHLTLVSASLSGFGLLLFAGLWTPVAGTLAALIEIVRLLRLEGNPLVCLLSAAMAGGLAMVGPGRWSVDARLFGWKRIEAPARRTG
jgi:hypothetical protein